MKLAVLLFLVLFGLLSHTTGAYRIVCYYTNWAQYRPDPMKFFPENIDPNLCTHIIYAFANLKGTDLVAFEWNDEDTDWSKGMYSRVMALKQKKSSLKILLAVGGWNAGSQSFSDMVANTNSRAAFIKSTVNLLQKYKFDGFDLDWEYPANRDGARAQDKQLFTVLCQELKTAFAPYNWLLSAAVAAGKATIDTAYEIDKISPILDFINLMTYDMHGSWETKTGHNSPLYARRTDTGTDLQLTQDFAANYWIQKGCPKEKLNLGLATYGRSFTLSNPSQNGMGAAAKAAGNAGQMTREAGFLAYYEVCDNLNKGFKKSWENDQKVPYASNLDQWVGYDDVDSLTIKANYIKSSGFGGAMFWALDLDDFNGKYCGQGNYPLIKAVSNILSGGQVIPDPQPKTDPNSTPTPSPNTIPQSTSSSTPKSSTQSSTSSQPKLDPNNVCSLNGKYVANKSDGCKSFFICLYAGTPQQQIQTQQCSTGLLFDNTLQTCNWAASVSC